MVKLVDTPDLGSGAVRCGGSSPFLGKIAGNVKISGFFYFKIFLRGFNMSSSLAISYTSHLNQLIDDSRKNNFSHRLKNDLQRCHELILAQEHPYSEIWDEEIKTSPLKKSLLIIKDFISKANAAPSRDDQLSAIKELTQRAIQSLSKEESLTDLDFIDFLQLSKLHT